jgi:hypothetical protein
MVVKAELEALGLRYQSVEIGEAVLKDAID